MPLAISFSPLSTSPLSPSILLFRENHSVIHIALAFRNVAQFAAQEGLAQGRNPVDMDVAFQMVVFVLYDAGAYAFEHFLVFHEVLVLVADADLVLADDLLKDVRHAQAAFLESDVIAEELEDFGIDEHLLEVLAIRIIGIERIAVDDEETYGFVDLRGGQTDAFGMGQCLPHVLHEFV